ncbi:hypothetical protein Hanom_Chr03g00208371 [Helianthus anomalus]
MDNILRRIEVIQRKRKAREVLPIEWKTDKVVLVGDAYPVPYNSKEVAKLMKFFDLKRKGKIAGGEIVDEESDIELFGDEDEEDEDKIDDKGDDKPDDKDGKDDDSNDQGASGLLIRDPAVQEKIDQLMNDEINEQEDEGQNEASSSREQPVDQVEVRRTRAEMVEELGLEDGKFKFDIEDEIPHSPEKDFEPRYPHEAGHYDEDGRDFHYEGIYDTLLSFAEMFKD